MCHVRPTVGNPIPYICKSNYHSQRRQKPLLFPATQVYIGGGHDDEYFLGTWVGGLTPCTLYPGLIARTLHPTFWAHTLHPAPCTLGSHPAPRTLYSELTLCTLHPTPWAHTLHPTPSTLVSHPAPYNLHPAPCTLHPTTYTKIRNAPHTAAPPASPPSRASS